MNRKSMRQTLLTRVLLPGLLLGLPFAGLMVGETSEAAQADPEPFPCNHSHEVVAVAISEKGLQFLPDRCLKKGGTVWFFNQCKDKTWIAVSGPEWEPDLSLPYHGEGMLTVQLKGEYKVYVEGCPGLPDDSKIGTLEVGTGPGEG